MGQEVCVAKRQINLCLNLLLGHSMGTQIPINFQSCVISVYWWYPKGPVFGGCTIPLCTQHWVCRWLWALGMSRAGMCGIDSVDSCILIKSEILHPVHQSQKWLEKGCWLVVSRTQKRLEIQNLEQIYFIQNLVNPFCYTNWFNVFKYWEHQICNVLLS